MICAIDKLVKKEFYAATRFRTKCLSVKLSLDYPKQYDLHELNQYILWTEEMKKMNKRTQVNHL